MAEKLPFERAEVSRDAAKQVFADDPLKLERIDDLGADEIISTYTDGPFVDLCRYRLPWHQSYVVGRRNHPVGTR